jgi:hypothetical protein
MIDGGIDDAAVHAADQVTLFHDSLATGINEWLMGALMTPRCMRPIKWRCFTIPWQLEWLNEWIELMPPRCMRPIKWRFPGNWNARANWEAIHYVYTVDDINFRPSPSVGLPFFHPNGLVNEYQAT